MKRIIKKLVSISTFSLKSQGSSMFPILQSGDIVYYKKISFKQIRVNDLVLINRKDCLFIHRVIYKTSQYLITKGDNNFESDGKIYPKQIIAKVIKVKREDQVFNPENLYLLQSTLYFQEIVKIKKIFEREKIDFVFLKGLPLHLYIEKTHPKRIYLDCDGLINKQDFNRLKNILSEAHYKSIDSSLSDTHTKLREKTIEQSFYKVINGFSVVFDVHLEIDWLSPQLGKLNALYPQNLIDKLTNEILLTKRPVRIQDEQFFILDPSFLILYLTLHFFHHNFRGAFRLEFLDKIWRGQSSVKTDLIAEKIKQYQLQNFVYPTFLLLKKYYRTPIPVVFLKSIRPASVIANRLGTKIYRRTVIFDDEPRITAGINRFKDIFFLSPVSWWKRVFTLSNPLVLYSVFWICMHRSLTIIKTFVYTFNDYAKNK